MYTLDANIFARTLQANQPDYAISEALIAQLTTDGIPIIVPLILLAEVASAARQETGDSMRARVFVDVIRSLPTIRFVPLDERLAASAAELAADEGLRGMDAIYVAVARDFGCILVTLDAMARRRAQRIVSVQLPDQALTALRAHS